MTAVTLPTHMATRTRLPSTRVLHGFTRLLGACLKDVHTASGANPLTHSLSVFAVLVINLCEVSLWTRLRREPEALCAATGILHELLLCEQCAELGSQVSDKLQKIGFISSECVQTIRIVQLSDKSWLLSARSSCRRPHFNSRTARCPPLLFLGAPCSSSGVRCLPYYEHCVSPAHYAWFPLFTAAPDWVVHLPLQLVLCLSWVVIA